MSLAKMTILGMETYLKDENSSLFKDISLPNGINKDLVVDTIILKCAELETFYPDPYYMKAVTEHFFLKKYHTFEEWLRGLEATYNPIENYDRYEDWTDTGYQVGRTSADTDTKGSNSSKASDTTGVTGSGTTTNTVTTDNSNVYQPDNQTSSSSGSTSNSSTEGSGEMANHTNFVQDTSDSKDDKHTGHIHGNIGVTTAPAMLKEFYDISVWNLYDHIADAYKCEFCVGVYV